MESNFIFIDEFAKILRAVTGQGGFRKVRILGKKILGCGIDIGEIASSAAGNTDFFADRIILSED